MDNTLDYFFVCPCLSLQKNEKPNPVKKLNSLRVLHLYPQSIAGCAVQNFKN